MNLQHFLIALETIFPKDSALEGDRVGLQVESGKSELNSCLIAYEITDEVANEACVGDYDCIICFHPLIFSPLQTITSDNRVGRVIIKLIAKGIAVFVIHTNLDTHPKGTNVALAKTLGLENIRFLEMVKSYTDRGMGIIGEWAQAKTLGETVSLIGRVLDSPIRYSKVAENSMITTLALVAGSGYEYIAKAKQQGADAFFTADAKYHNFHAALDSITLIEAGHEEMERHVPLTLYNILAQTINDVYFTVSSVRTSPIRYSI